jgi:hypothetical protein
MQPPGPRSREETRRLATAFSLENLARAEARDTSSLTVSSEDWMPPSPTKLLRRLTLRGPASNTVEPGLTSSVNPGAAPASPSRQISRLFGRSAPPTHNIPSPRLRSKAPPWLSTAGGGRTPGIDTNVEPQRSTSPLKRLRELRQQLGRSGKLPETAAAAAAAGRRNTCQTYDQERNAVKQRRLDDARRASLAKAPPKPAVRDPEPSAVTAALASLARDNTASTAHKNKLGAYHDVLASAAETAIYELGKLGAQDTVQKEAAALTAVDIGTLVECFAEADADMSGQIEEAEWPTALEAMKRRWPNEPHSVAEVAGSGFSGTHERLTEAQVIFRQLDLDCDGKVSFSEFVLHRQRQHWVRLRARKALSTRSEGQLAAERLVTAKLHANITQISQLQTAESMRGWGG